MTRTETYQRVKEEAVKLMTRLGVYSPYVNAFKSAKQKITMYEGFGAGYFMDGYTEESKMILDRINKMESETENLVVYAVVHNKYEFGECYEFLYLTADDLTENDDEKIYYFDGDLFCTCCCVYNKTYDEIEYGDCAFAVPKMSAGFVRKG